MSVGRMRVFADVYRTIDALLAELPADVSGQVSITFATPDESFPPNGVSLPAINLFLLEIHENTDLRAVEPLVERHADGSTLRVPPPVHIDCHYLVTAMAEKQLGSEEDELRILGATVRIADIVRDLERSVDRPMRPEVLARVSPLWSGHVVASGTYQLPPRRSGEAGRAAGNP